MQETMFENVLVALDGSEHGARALRMAVGLAQRCRAGLVLLHAVQTSALRSDYDVMVARSARAVFEKIGREQADAILGEAEQAARAAGIERVERVVADGDPVKAVLGAVPRHDVGLVVVGTRGLSGLQEFALGSVAHKLTVAAPCPVLVVK
jgi:nucleotide-binding universal stress UspA family protein